MRIIDYKIIGSIDHLRLVSYVVSAMLDGWQPFGGICFAGDEFVQAMVKYADES